MVLRNGDMEGKENTPSSNPFKRVTLPQGSGSTRRSRGGRGDLDSCTLLLRGVTEADEGEWACHVITEESGQWTERTALNVFTPANIFIFSDDLSSVSQHFRKNKVLEGIEVQTSIISTTTNSGLPGFPERNMLSEP